MVGRHLRWWFRVDTCYQRKAISFRSSPLPRYRLVVLVLMIARSEGQNRLFVLPAQVKIHHLLIGLEGRVVSLVSRVGAECACFLGMRVPSHA